MCVLSLAVSFFFLGCGQKQDASLPNPSSSFGKMTSFSAAYNAQTGEVTYQVVKPGESKPLTTARGLTYNDTTGLTNPDGVTGGAIRDTSKSYGDINYEMGLVDPDSCTTEYNSATHTLSFYTRLRNRSDLPNTAPYQYQDITDFPPNTTFYTPFYYVITGLDWDTVSYPTLITAVNTNLVGASCSAQNGLTLANCDTNANNRFDSIWPDNAVSTYDGLPGWDFSSFVSNNNMTPGEDTGCVLFMQYTLTQNQSFVVYFDLLGVKDDGTLPPTPTVTVPSASTTYVNTSTTTVTITNCAVGRTLYVEGGSSVASAACTGASQSVSVPLNTNTSNTLNIYQKDNTTLKQSPAVTKTVVHDNIAPTLVSSTPANAEVSVNENSNCVLTFSEAMKTSTFTSGTNCSNGSFQVCQGATFFAGAVSFSTDATQAVYNPTSALATNTASTCKATTAITDLAGNALASTQTISFTTRNGAAGADVTPPFVKNILPVDNAFVPLNSSIYIYFSEPINATTLTNTDCDSGTGNAIPNISFMRTNACPLSSPPTPRPIPITGTLSVNADSDIVTFTPSSALTANDCMQFIVSRCITDLSGNQLASRGTFAVGAYSTNAPNYNNQSIDYNTYNIFYTLSTSDSTAPILAHVGPMSSATNVHRNVFPFFIFNEAIDPATMIGDYFFTNIFGSTTKVGATIRGDYSSQFIQIRPNAALTASTDYVMTATGAVTDIAGNQMTAPQTSGFTIGASSDSTAPTVVSVVPTNLVSASNISKCSSFDVKFSEALDLSTVNGTNIKIERVSDSSVKPTTLSYDASHGIVRLIPDSSFDSTTAGAGKQFRVRIANVKDRAGNTISAYTGTTYTAVTETTLPTVLGFAPPNGSTVSQNGSFSVFFSEAMDKTTLTNANFTFGGGACGIYRSVYPSEDGKWATVNCYHNMTAGASRTLSLAGASVKDYYTATNNSTCEGNVGNAIGGTPSITYTVSGTSDTTAPTVSAVSPTDGSTSVSTSVAPTITFNEEIDPRTLKDTTILLMSREGVIIPSTISISSTAKVITLTPATTLSNPGIYYIIATTAIRDLGGANAYDGNGGETVSVPGILRTCFSTSAATCP